MYHAARLNPSTLYIGIDASASSLTKISEKIYRNPNRGGAPNVLYLLAAAEDLPAELESTANEVTVFFPWGSLLRAMARPDVTVLSGIRRICRPRATIKIVFGLDPARDRSEVARLDLPDLTQGDVRSELVHRYGDAGFEVVQAAIVSEPASLPATSWAKRLRNNLQRNLFELVAVRA